MKKVYLLLAALCCMIFTAKATDMADRVVVKIGTYKATAEDKDNFTSTAITAGTVSYDDENHILTLNGATIKQPLVIDASADGGHEVTIYVKGINKIDVTESTKHGIHLEKGLGLIISGDADATLDVSTGASGDACAILSSLSYDDPTPANWYPLTVKDLNKLSVSNHITDGNFEPIVAKEIKLKKINFYGHAFSGTHVFYTPTGYEPDCENVEIMYKDGADPCVADGYAYNEAYPVWVNGFQLNDGKSKLINTDMDDISYGELWYEPATRTVWVESFLINAQNEKAEAALVINDAAHADDVINIVVTENSGSVKFTGQATGVRGLLAKTNTLIRPHKNTISFIAEYDKPALEFERGLTIRSLHGGKAVVDAQLATGTRGLYGSGSDAKLTVDATIVEVVADGITASGFEYVESDVETSAPISGPDVAEYDNTAHTLKLIGVEVTGKKWVITPTKTYTVGTAVPAIAGMVEISEGGSVVENPYKFAGGGIDLSYEAKPAEGWIFTEWEDDNTKPNPRVETTVAGKSSEFKANFARQIASDANWYAIDGKDIKLFPPKLRGDLGAKIEELPGTGDLFNAVFFNGKIIYSLVNSSKAGLFAVTFNAEAGTIGTQETLVDYSDTYNEVRAMAASSKDGCVYVIIRETSSSKVALAKLDGTTLTPIGYIDDEIKDNVVALADDKDGNLFLVANTTPARFCSVSKTDAKTTMVGEVISTKTNKTIYLSSYSNTAMAFDQSTGELILIADIGILPQYYCLNPVTAKADWIQDAPMVGIRGIFQVEKTYTISVAVAAGQSERGDVNINGGGKTGAFAEGTTITLNAVAKETWKFEKWDDDDTNASRSFTVGTEDKSFTASFIQDPDYEPYPVWVGEKRLYNGKKKLTSSDYAAITAGSIELDPATNILTLDNLKMTVTGSKEGIKIEPETAGGNYRIIVAGDCQINADIQALNLRKCSSVTLEAADATAKLTLKGSSGIDFVGPAVEIKGLQVIAQGTAYGITSDKNTALTITGAKVEAKGTSTGSVYEIGSLVLNYCSITAPTGAKFSEENNQVEVTAGVATKDNVVFTPWPKLSVKPVQEGTGSFTLKPEEGESFENEGWFKSGTKVTITANPASGFDFAYWNEGGYSTESEKEYTTTASDKQFSALFYFKAQSTANWYGVNDNKYVKFSLKDHGEEVAKSSTSGSGVKAGDFVDSRWIYVDGTTVKSRDFSNLEDGEALEDATDIKTGAPSGVTDMAYDLKRKIMYAVVGKDLYSVDDEGKAEKLGALKYNTSDVLGIAIAVDANSAIYILAKDGTDGKLYTVKDIDTEGSKVNLAIVGEESNEGKVGATVLDEQQSIAFDHVTGELIWGAPDYLRVIDLATAKAYIAGALKLSKGSQKAIKAMHRMDKMVKVNVQVADGQSSRGTAAVGSGEAQSASVLVGANATIVATPKSGYQFKCWKILDDTEVASTNASFTFTVKKKVTYVAYFEEKPESIDNINAEAAPMQKLLIDGQLYIIRDGRIYNAAGQLVK